MGFSPTLSPFTRVAVKNAVGAVIQSFLKNLKFTGGVTVSQVGDDTVVNVTPGGIAGDPNTVTVFDSLGNISDDPGQLTYDKTTKVLNYPHFTTIQRNALPAQPVDTLIFNSTTQSFQTWNGAVWTDINAGSATPPNGDNNAIATFGPAGAFGDDPNFTWIAASKSFGIGRALPQCLIQVRGSNNAGTGAFASDGIIFGFTHPTQNLGAGSFVIGGTLGSENYASGAQSFAGGIICAATGLQTFAFGELNIASGQNSFAIGQNNLASELFSFAMGLGNQATGQQSSVWGSNNVAQGFNQAVFGFQNIPQGTSNAFIVGDDLVQCGNGSLRNPFSITNDGKTRMEKVIWMPDATQTLLNGFSVAPNDTEIYIDSAGAVTSDVVDPIGLPNENGMKIEIINIGAFNITFKAGGSLKTPGGVDLILTPNSVLAASFRAGTWYTSNVSLN